MYSPYMLKHRIFLFFESKENNDQGIGTQYVSIEGVIAAMNEYLGDKENAVYFEGIRKLEQGWAMCIALKKYYIEK